MSMVKLFSPKPFATLQRNEEHKWKFSNEVKLFIRPTKWISDMNKWLKEFIWTALGLVLAMFS